jgi:uncharacterized membrane protein
MVSQIIVGIITWLHIVSVIGWTGTALTFLFSIRPSLGKLSPQASAEFVVKVMPRFVRSVQVFTVLTLVFGPQLAFTMSDGPPNQFNLVSPWSIFVTIGASIGITMFFVVFFLFTPTATNIVRIVKQMQQNPQQPPPAKFNVLQKRLAMIPPLGVTLLLSAEVFMVAAAQF